MYENPLILLLLGSSVVSALLGSYDDAICVVIAVAIVLTGESSLSFSPQAAVQPSCGEGSCWTGQETDAHLAVGFVQEQRSEKSLEALNKVRLPVCREMSELADHGSWYPITAT